MNWIALTAGFLLILAFIPNAIAMHPHATRASSPDPPIRPTPAIQPTQHWSPTPVVLRPARGQTSPPTASPPSTTCSHKTCFMYCKNGFKKDSNGCNICRCKLAPTCNPNQCRMICQHGFQKDSNGCEICPCNPPPTCPPIQCSKYCVHGFQKDSNGCEICGCNPPQTCSRKTCFMYCKNGFKKDSNGCNICRCKPAPTCNPNRCRMRCQHGFQKDSNGCEICRCNPSRNSCDVNVEDSCFTLSDDSRTWLDAAADCRSKNGSLASVMSQLQHDALKQQMQRKNWNATWLGGQETKTDWCWTRDGSFIQLQGCYAESGITQPSNLPSFGITPSTCVKACKHMNYTYAAIQYQGRNIVCQCGNSYNINNQTRGCTRFCHLDKTTRCGGLNKQHVYRIDAASGLYLWYRGQPNDYYPYQECLAMHNGEGYRWGDMRCYLEYYYICQYSYSHSACVAHGYIFGALTCYELVEDKKTWHNARFDCETRGGSLLKMAQQEQFDSIKSKVQTVSVRSKWWLGGTNRQWTWTTTASEIKFTAWGKNKPERATESCLMMRRRNNPNYGWDDEKCTEKLNYVCQLGANALQPTVARAPNPGPPIPPTPAIQPTKLQPPTPAAPSICSWAPWRAWGSCSRTCGTGSQKRYRFLAPSSQCSFSSLSQTQPCNLKTCLVCAWEPWESWESCTKTCGSGSQRRYRYPTPRSKCVISFQGQTRTCNVTTCPGQQCGKPQTRRPVMIRHRIINGNMAEKHAWPWMVQLRLNRKGGWMHVCGGALIAPGWVLTAGHCTYIGIDFAAPHQLHRWEVILGEHDLDAADGTETKHKVIRVIRHPGYDKQFGYSINDIALMEISPIATFSMAVLPACLPTQDVMALSGSGTVTGWGTMQNMTSSRFLMEVELPFVEMATCNSERMYNGKTRPGMFCAGYDQGGKDSCEGDSGGPFVWYDSVSDTFYLVGLVSWGNGCALPNWPGVYTDVYYYHSWIHSNMSP